MARVLTGNSSRNMRRKCKCWNKTQVTSTLAAAHKHQRNKVWASNGSKARRQFSREVRRFPTAVIYGVELATLCVTSREFGSEGVGQEHQESAVSSRHRTFLVVHPTLERRRRLVLLFSSRFAQLKEKDQSVTALRFKGVLFEAVFTYVLEDGDVATTRERNKREQSSMNNLY